jgi:hypothetical protein
MPGPHGVARLTAAEVSFFKTNGYLIKVGARRGR